MDRQADKLMQTCNMFECRDILSREVNTLLGLLMLAESVSCFSSCEARAAALERRLAAALIEMELLQLQVADTARVRTRSCHLFARFASITFTTAPYFFNKLPPPPPANTLPLSFLPLVSLEF